MASFFCSYRANLLSGAVFVNKKRSRRRVTPGMTHHEDGECGAAGPGGFSGLEGSGTDISGWVERDHQPGAGKATSSFQSLRWRRQPALTSA
jgi:hypothetical protein